ncbi:hypothetical protein HRI_003995200 [Hibiscus trionum]|uniref:Uncharacterized protein n=1 Tax=Hibiscus trionum TaxID=183268 RepID=A0A9W7IVB8_HIBTR|nr:hypothetical protein HRI_003995200 [Hibiscus trionum]
MEDIVPEAVIPREDDEVAGEERQNPEAVKEHGEERADGGGGFITHLFSNFVNGGTDGDDGENTTEQAEKETIGAGAEGGNEEKGGGIFDHIISNLVSPLSPRTGNISSSQGKVEAFDDTSASQNEAEEEGSGGGLISNFMSNLFHHSEGEAGEERNKRQKVEEAGEYQSKAEKTEDGGGIIDNIVSQLPTSLPDGAAPSSDEATILIHIVQD